MRVLISMLLMLAGCATTARQSPDGVEVAVAFDRTGERGASAAGLADPATGRRATPDDPVRIASISKLVVAIGVMRLVEQGKLDLDYDVSRWLGYPVRNPAFPAKPVSLRQLLSHTSSLRDHDDQYAIPLGESLRSVLVDPNSWDAARGPGAGYFTYANLNLPVVASIMERATGERFDRLMQRLVLAPIKLDACFNWPTCSDDAVARAVVLTEPDGNVIRDDLKGRRPDCAVFVREGRPCDLSAWRPGDNGALFSPQGGLRISARGLARIGRMLASSGEIDGQRILSHASVAAMLGPHWVYDGTNGDTDEGFYCRYGLGIQLIGTGGQGCNDDIGGDLTPRFGHAGEAYGLRSGIWFQPVSGRGVAYFTTALGPDPERGRTAFRAAEERAFERAVSIGQQRP